MYTMLRKGLAGTVAALAVSLTASGAAADAVSDFYKGKTFEIHVGFAPGGGYDTYARLLARHIGKHIPGNPNVIVKNKTGSATVKLTNILYNKGPMNGTVMGMVARGIPTHAMLGGTGGKYDPAKFHWVGSMNNEVSACVVHDRANAATFTDLLKNEVIVGGVGTSSDADQFTNFVNNLMGAKMKLITGYPGTAVIVLAIDRGEVNGICGWSWTSIKQMRGGLVKNGKLKVLMQMALKKHPELPNVPLITDLARNKNQLLQMELIFSRQTIGRPFLLPPKVPQARVAAIRTAFVSTMKDPAFVALINKSKLELNWVDGNEVQALVERVLATPKDVVAAARQNIFPKGPVQQAKLTYLDASGKIGETRRGGRRMTLIVDGQKQKFRVSGSGTKITVDGEKAKRKAVKVGMNCTISYLGPNTTARSMNCKP
ncbi:MAG: tripartite tricarboxylate transporter substrate-binding protein [Proteobacteria bacterium]|nr:tripartite tricarboxylate transporter substrate-binding protein [Pseudomonadota bacterium]